MTALEWQPTERYPIRGRGILMVGPYPFNESAAEIIGRELLIDGEVWLVAGTETIGAAKQVWPDSGCGLLMTRKEKAA